MTESPVDRHLARGCETGFDVYKKYTFKKDMYKNVSVWFVVTIISVLYLYDLIFFNLTGWNCGLAL